MVNTKKEIIKKIFSSYPDSIIYYHEHNEWTIYHPGRQGKDEVIRIEAGNELLEGNDYLNAAGYAPELVMALAEMLGIRVKSNARGR